MRGSCALAWHRTLCLAIAVVGLCKGQADTAPASSPTPAGSVQWLGRLEALQASCKDGNGNAAVSFTARGLSEDIASMDVACKVVSWNLLQTTRALTLRADTGETQDVQNELFIQIQNATGFPAALTPMIPFGDSSAIAEQDASFLVKCQIPAPQSGTTIVLVAQNLSGLTILVPPLAALNRSSIDSISPLLGPASGGTNVTIQGFGLSLPATCTFSNSSVTVSVPGVVLNSTTMTCLSPSWSMNAGNGGFSLGTSESEQVNLVVSIGGCAAADTFQFYSEPLIVGVTPLQGPRYGSFAFKVNLGNSLHSFGRDGMDSLQPAIRIKGADFNGSDLILSANLTEDRMALMATTPVERTPLAMGDHPVHVSLNGQQFAELPSLDPTVLTVQGPLLSFEKPFYKFTNGRAIQLGVVLEGESNLPVAVRLSAVMRSAALPEDNLDTSLGLEFSLNQSSLVWGSEESGVKYVELSLQGQVAALSQVCIVVTLDSAKNADVSSSNSSSVTSAMDQEQLIVGFEVEYDQVVYRGENASLPIIVQNALMRLPATIEYDILDLYGNIPAYLEEGQQSGVLEWDAELGNVLLLDLDIDWSNVSLHLEDHLVIQFGKGWNARALGNQDGVALHVFGVQPGQCPPGTFRFSEAEAMAPRPSSAEFQSTAGWLDSIRVQDSRNWFFDLSSRFQPDVPEYGVILPTKAENASLCLEPKQVYSAITVLDSKGQKMQQNIGIMPAQELIPTSFAASGGRKLLEASAPRASSPQALTHGNASWANTLGRPGNTSACAGLSWILPLIAGQNVFSITHGDLQAPPPAPTPAPVHRNGTSSTLSPANTQAGADMTYSLSIVRLAASSHAEVSELNITAGNTTFTVCSGVQGRPAANRSSGYFDLSLPVCSPSSTMHVNISSDSAIVKLSPGLRYPGVQNVRVEVAGQVLSQGGNVGADQLADTSDEVTERSNAGFLPAAYIVGLQPGLPVSVPILVVAEDGVTSNRYFVSLYRDLPKNTSNSTTESANALPPAADGNGQSMLDVTVSLASDLSSPPPPSIVPVSAQAHASWPTAPSRQPMCHICPAGWATTQVDQSHCNMCVPGSYAASPQSPVCRQCSNGSYTNSWGSTSCNHCIMGTYAPYRGSRLCFMCPENLTNLEDGSSRCDIPVRPGTNLLMRYAVIVSFGVYLKGTTLEAIASKVGVNASSTIILERLIGLDTATAFNITSRDVNVTGIQQVGRRLLLVNVTATLGLDLPSNSSHSSVQAELAVKNLSADEAIHMLSQFPDKFLARTTKALDVTAAQGNSPASKVESRPKGARSDSLLPWYGIILVVIGGLGLLAMGFGVWRHRSRNQKGCWPRRQKAYAEFEDSTGEPEEQGVPANRGISTVTSRGRTSAASADHLPILNQQTSSSSIT